MNSREEILEKIIKGPNKQKPLSEDQEKAVRSDARYIRILAGAGAGKTETLTRRILYLLLYKNINPEEIVAFTFTEKAAQSMKNRIYQSIQEHGREDIAKRLGEMYVGTIHGFCLRILEEKFSSEGFGNHRVMDENQEMAFLMRIGWNIGIGKKGSNYSKLCSDFLANVSVVFGEYLDLKDVEKKAPEFFEKFQRYMEELDEKKALTFGKIIYECVKRVEEKPEKLGYIQHLIVDEFQDIDRAQFTLIKTIGNFASVFVVGDPRQTIYKWRGSNEEFFENFDKEFGPVEQLTIPENRRSGKKIVEVSNTFADTFEGELYPHMVAIRTDEGAVRTISTNDKYDEAQWVAEQVENLVKQGFDYSDMAILLRSVNTSAKPYIEEFKKRKIPYSVGGKVGLFKRNDAQAIGMLLSWLDDDGFWVTDPYRWSESQVDGDDLLLQGIKNWRAAVDFPLPSDLEVRLREWKKKVWDGEYKTFKEVYYALLVLLGYRNLDPSKPLDAAVAANLGRVSSMIQDFESARRIVEKRNPEWKKDLHALCWFMNSYATKAYEEHNGDDVGAVDAVQIMTVHQSKGLEWPIVFVSSLVSRRFPSSGSAVFKTKWAIPDDLFDRKRYEGGEEDEKRLFYVAMTRAQDVLVFTYFTNDGTRNRSRSKFLNMLNEKIALKVEEFYPKLAYSPKKVHDSTEMLSFSTTELIDYMICPHHYRLNKLWGYMQEMAPLIGYGQAMHYCMRRAAELMKEDGYKAIAAVNESVEKNFYLPFAPQRLHDRVKEKAKKTLIEFARTHEEDMKNIEEVETRIEFKMDEVEATIIGKVDVIIRDRDREIVEIRDYKTSDKVISQEDSLFQLHLYSFGLENLGWTIDLGSIAYLDKATVSPVTINEKDVNSAKKRAADVISRINRKEFPMQPREKNFCKECEYRMICKGAKI